MNTEEYYKQLKEKITEILQPLTEPRDGDYLVTRIDNKTHIEKFTVRYTPIKQCFN